MSFEVKAYVNKQGVWVCIDDLLKSLLGESSFVIGAVMLYLEKLRDKIIQEMEIEKPRRER